jgi:hypothetical protein
MGSQSNTVSTKLKLVSERDKRLDIATAADNLNNNVQLKVAGGTFRIAGGRREGRFLVREGN